MVSATHPMTRDAQMQDGVEGGGLVPVLDFHSSKSWWRNLEFKILSKKWSHTTELWVPEQIPSSLLGCCKVSLPTLLCAAGVCLGTVLPAVLGMDRSWKKTIFSSKLLCFPNLLLTLKDTKEVTSFPASLKL